MIAPKKTAKFANEKDITIYYINLPYQNVSKFDSNSWIYMHNAKYANITANKAESFGTWLDGYNTNVMDNRNNYETCMFYSNISPMSNYTSLIGVQRPSGKLYPRFLDFEGLGYSSTFSNAYAMAKGAGSSVSPLKFLKPFIVNQSGSYLAKYLGREDPYYYNMSDYTIRRKSDNSVFNGLPDINLFKPQSNPIHWYGAKQTWNGVEYYLTEAQLENLKFWNKDLAAMGIVEGSFYREDVIQNYIKNISREWCKHKYYACQLKTNKYIPNEKKFLEYIKTKLNKTDTYVSCESININSTPKADYIRYILQNIIPEYYQDFNEDFVFTVDGKKYTFDFDLEEIRDADYKLVNYIKTFRRIITMDNYTDLLKEFVTLEQKAFIADIQRLLRIGDYDFTGFGYDQYVNPTFTEGQIISSQYSNEDILKYDKKKGFVAIDTGGIDGVEESLVNGYDLIEYSDNVLSFNPDRTAETEQTFDKDKLSMLLFRLVTNIRDINVDMTDNKDLKQYYLYLHEKYVEVSNTGENKIELTPVLVFPGVTSLSKFVMRVSTQKWKRTYINENEILNYTNVFKDTAGRFYVYKNISTKLDTPRTINDYIIIKDDGTFEYIAKQEEYSSDPTVSTKEVDFIEDLTKFELPSIEFTLDKRIKTYITKFKENKIQGWFIKYYDVKGRLRIKLLEEDFETFMSNTCDVENEYLDVLPLVPFYSVLDSMIPLHGKSNALNLPLRGLAGEREYHNFYFLYNKKIVNYYKQSFKFPLKQWERSINKSRFVDEEYKVKTPKRVPKIYTDSSLTYYNGSLFQNPIVDSTAQNKVNNIGQSYDEYFRSGLHGAYGGHTAIRFNFAIFFNKFVRRTLLLNKMAVIYLEYFFSNFNGMIDIPFQMFVYPLDRVSYPEKRLLLKFTKMNLTNDEIAGLKAKYYSTFDYYAGTITFWDKRKSVKYILYITTLYPNWKNIFFEDRTFTKSLNSYDNMTITKDDIEPLAYTDTFTTTKTNVAPANVYKATGNIYQLQVNSYYYNTSVVIKYISQDNTPQTRTLNFWKNATEYRCFYTPYNPDEYNTLYSVDQLSNFIERNVYTYLKNFLLNLDKTTIEKHYNELFNTNITIDIEYNNIFDYKKMFSRGFMTAPAQIDFSKQIQDEVISNTPSVYLQDYAPNGSVNVNLPFAQSYTLYSTYNQKNLLTSGITKEDCIGEIIDYMFANDIIPSNKYITPLDFEKYFINYDKDGFLSKIMSEREIYELGFQNYLVTDDPNGLEDISVLLPTIQKKLGAYITNMDLNNNDIQLNNFWLPLPADAYKKFPFYCKKFVTTYCSVLEIYICRPIPMFDSSVWKENRTYKTLVAALQIVVAIILLIVSFVTFQPEGTVAAFLLISATVGIMASALSILMLYLPVDMWAEIQKFIRVLNVISTVTSIFSAGVNFTSLNWIQITNMVITSINFALSITNTSVEMYYTKLKNKETERLNEKIEEYNESVDELNKFLEENEFSDELNMVNPTNITLLERNKMNDKYDEFFEEYVQNSLDLLYTNIDDYYTKRLD